MKNLDRISSLFWLFFAIYILIESIHIGIGRLQKPHAGFMAFCGSLLLGIFSLTLFLQTFFRKEPVEPVPSFSIPLWKRVSVILLSLIIYVIIFEKAGYLIATFLLMTFLLASLREMKWRWILVTSFLITFLSYYVFTKGLGVQFPYGLFGF
jgi:putative tricarboxylic transport membrane protein